ncbi:hypothetical protein SCHPADRAFT_907840 [Schizopora paradoxa]|uniref:BCAS3 WD40 domain-containing protein n=1 Tax=Schizopora paradoxa TaxID=27342 RepID=A0A0H2RBX6_9AGAM|nr:hypothetical protein SCHPADRAFT_907840 [Schizopora paradoxa]
MYNTPASRTSRHGSSKKQRRAKRSQSRPTTPVTTSVLPEPVVKPMDNATEAKEEGLQNEPEGTLDIVLDAEPVMEEVSGAESVQAAEGGTNDAMDAWFPEAMVAPQEPLEEQSFPALLPDVYAEDHFEHSINVLDVEDVLHPSEEVELLQQPTPFDEPTSEAAPSGPAELAPMPDQVNEDLLLSINVGAERAREEDYRTLDHATSPVKKSDMADKANDEERVDAVRGDDIEFPPATTEESFGHVRAPIIARRQTNTSTLSRQLKNVQSYLPTSPQLPTFGLSNLSLASFSAPGISNVTVNASGFNRPPRNMSDSFVSAKEARRRSTGMYADRERLQMTSATPIYASDEDEMSPSTPARPRVFTSVSPQGRDKIEFASFHSLLVGTTSRRLLLIGFENGLQIWDTTNLGEVQEILNRRIPGAVTYCGILPTPRIHPSNPSQDSFSGIRPLIGIVIEDRDTTYLSVYSLATHEVVRKLDFSGAYVTSFQASTSFIVVSTSYPPSLHILSTRTLNVLYTIQGRNLILFSRPRYQQPNSHQQPSNDPTYAARQDYPHAVFALSHRLMAFASLPPATAQSSRSGSNPHTATPQSPSIQIGPLNVSQADIGNAALKVGGGLLNGMKALGGFAAAAARGESITTAYTERSGGFRGLFSRSAPEAPRHERRYSEYSDGMSSRRGRSDDPATPTITTLEERIAHVTILDLQPLLSSDANAKAECITKFALPAGQSVAGLEFSEDGQALSVIPSDGSVVRVYQIRPKPSALRSGSSGSSPSSPHSMISPDQTFGQALLGSQENINKSILMTEDEHDNDPWHVYDLRRGRTSGIIESLKYSVDNRWIALGSRKRTIHVFATNPYWGRPDDASHLDGRVRNASTLQPLSTELHPIVRLRSPHVASLEQYTVPLAYSFISSSPNSLPTKYLPAPSSFSSPHSIPSSLPSSSPTRSRRQSSSSPRVPVRPTNYQDVVVFDPVDGRLSLHRITISINSGDGTTSILSNIPLPSGTSISLPGMSFMRPSSSPSKSFTPPSQAVHRLETSVDLSAASSTVATWDLMRKKNWKEVKVALQPARGRSGSRQAKYAKSEWLSQSELSTCSRSPQILPTSVYLSHQFSFFAFGEDYHALLRRLFFDVPVNKIEVRREVEASAYSSGQGELFVAGSSPQEIRNAHAAFDAPLASAMSASLDYSGQSPPVIPMLPNGGRPGSFKASIPIRSVAAGLTEGVNGGFGRLRREIKKVRSPRLRPQAEDRTPGPVPLEFDEDDEVFVGQMEQDSGEHDSDAHSAGTSRGDSGASISTPSTNNNAPLPDSEPEGWSLDDMDGLDEEEKFDEISTAGFMDEEQRNLNVPIRVPGQKPSFGRKGR